MNKISITEENYGNNLNDPHPDLLNQDCKIDHEKQRYPYCIVWTPLPCISCCCPCIGHIGIAGSDGKIHDFAGSCSIGIDDFAFDKPYKYTKLELRGASKETFDKAIQAADQDFESEDCNISYYLNLFTKKNSNNCHHHVARALSHAKYNGKSNWSQFGVWCLTVKARYVSQGACVKVYVGFIILLIIVVLVAILTPVLKVNH